MASLANRHISAFEVYWEQNTHGNKNWHSIYNFPKIGILFKYFNLNNSDVLGNAFSISYYFKFNIYNSENFSLRFRPSIGLAYLGKTFNTEDNFENIAIGSNINMHLSASIESEIKLFKNTNAILGLGLDHQSNTGFKTPNLGINMPFLTAGVNHNFGKKNKLDKAPISSFTKKPFYWQISAGFGFNEINPPNGKKYIVKAITITREKKLNQKSTIGYGIDLSYNPAHIAFLEKDSISINSYENTQVGLTVIHILDFGILSFTGQLSYYLKNENDDLGKIYHVFGGRCQINEHWNAFFSGKTHIDKAEYLLFGFGYKL